MVKFITSSLSEKHLFKNVFSSHDQNSSYEIAINGFQVRKINEIRNVIFGLRYGKPSSMLRPKSGCSPVEYLMKSENFGGKLCQNNEDS